MAHHSTVWGSLEAGTPQHAPSQKRWIWALPIVIFALLGAAASWHFFPALTGGSPTASADFSLDLQRAGTDYRVAWDPQAPAILAAKRGTLFIKDGNFQKELALDREQLLGASVVYSPATTDVSFRLELFGGPEPAVASVRLLAGSKPELTVEAPAPQTARETAPPPAVTAPPPVEQLPAESADQPASPDVPATMAAAPKPDEIPAPAR